jgi:two-component system, OmpR family, sensor histidine kinase SenX3
MDMVQRNSFEKCIIDLFPAGILIFDSEDSILAFNQFAKNTLGGLCNPELIRCWDDFLLFTNIAAPTNDAQLSRDELTIANKNYVLYSQKLPWNKQTIRIVYIADITEEKRLITDIHKKTSSVLTGIRTRVTGIQNALTLLADYNLSPEESASLINDARYDIWLLSRYADNLKDLSLFHANAFSDALFMQPVLLSSLIDETVENIKIFRIYNNNATPITIDVSSDIKVNCDRARTAKVIESILLNSLIYAGAENKINITATMDERWVILTISDHGMGIPIEDQQRIFEYRFRGRNKDKVKYSGMGIELFLSRLNISSQEGTLSFSSKEGLGTSFEIVLKRVSSAENE